MKKLLFVIVAMIVLGVIASAGAVWAGPAFQGTVTGGPPQPPEGVPYCCLPGVAFTSTRDGNQEIYVMRYDGTGPTRLTNLTPADRNPGPSPDGTRIAFMSNRDDPDPQTCGTAGKPNCIYHLYVMNIDGTGQTRLTDGAFMDEMPNWSVGGAFIAFVSNRDDPDPKTCGQSGKPACVKNIFIIGAGGGGLFRLTTNPPSNPTAQNLFPNWAPDDTQLAFQSNRDGNDEIYVINNDGSGLRRLTSNAASDGHPGWSPDGKRIAFETNRDGHFEIYVMNADGSGQMRVTTNPSTNPNADSRHPIWLPGCVERIVFDSTRDGNVLRIFAVDGDGSNLVRLTTLPAGQSGDDFLPAWSGLPAALRTIVGPCCVPGIAFDSLRDGNQEIYIMEHDGARQTRLTFNPAVDKQPAPSPDGTRIAFVSNRDGLFQIYVMNVDGSGTQRLTTSNGNDFEPHWSNDGTRLAFVSTRDDPDPRTCGTTGKSACVEHIYVMNANGGAVARLTTNPAASPTAQNEDPAWSADSKQIAFSSTRDTGKPQVYAINVDGTGLTRLTNDTASDGHPSYAPDNKRIVFETNRDGNYEIYVMDADGKNATRVTNNAAEDRRPYWCPSCVDRIVFATNRDGVFSIYTTNPTGDNQVRLTVPPLGTGDDNPAWSGLPVKIPRPVDLPPATPTPVR